MIFIESDKYRECEVLDKNTYAPYPLLYIVVFFGISLKEVFHGRIFAGAW